MSARRFSVVLALAGAVAAGWWLRRSEPPRPPPPAPRPFAGAKKARPDAPSAERAVPLVDAATNVTVKAPTFENAYKQLRKANWRTLTQPWKKQDKLPPRFLQILAFTTEQADEREPVNPDPKAWKPDERTWNLTKASFDVRESLVVPPPGEMRFAVSLPDKARLEVSYGVVSLPAATMTFEVAVHEAGKRTVVDTFRIPASRPHIWHDRKIDLAAFSRRDVEIELSTRTTYEGEDIPSGIFGSPTLVGDAPVTVPYNVLWFVVDAMRPDPLPQLHEPDRDERRKNAPLQPYEAWLNAMPTVVPNLDALARSGTVFVDTASAATWTRPGTVAMLVGARSSEVGLDTTDWVLNAESITNFYATKPPLFPLFLRGAGVAPAAFVNNFFMTGYARVGVDLGFFRMVDHRHDGFDTRKITKDVIAYVEAQKDRRFFAFVNYNSPHNPYEPPPRLRPRVPEPPVGPTDPNVRAYLAEIAKDDEAIGQVVDKLGELGLRERTIVVVTADHGETLSREHGLNVPGFGEGMGSTRFRHANAMYEETARIPVVFSMPGTIRADKRSKQPASNADIVPTLLELLGIERDARMSGKSLVPYLVGDAKEDPERPLVTEGRAARSVRIGKWRYVERDPLAREIASATIGHKVWKEELYDLESDPGERRNVADERREIVERMRAALADALRTSTAKDARESDSLAGSKHVARDLGQPAKYHLRFAGEGRSRRVAVTLRVRTSDKSPAKLSVVGVSVDAPEIRVAGIEADAAFTTLPKDLVGLEVEVFPSSARLEIDVSFDDKPLPPERVFSGRFGLAMPTLAKGVLDAEARRVATAETLPLLDPGLDWGMLLVRDPGLDTGIEGGSDEAMGEMKSLLEGWGYAKPK